MMSQHRKNKFVFYILKAYERTDNSSKRLSSLFLMEQRLYRFCSLISKNQIKYKEFRETFP